jgi:hypothetical protein
MTSCQSADAGALSVRTTATGVASRTQSFGWHLGGGVAGHPSHIAPWPPDARHEPDDYRIRNRDEHDRDGARRFLCGGRGSCAPRDENINRKRHQSSGGCEKLLWCSIREAFFYDNVATDDVTCFTQARVKSINYGRDTRPSGKEADGPHLPRLLRLGRERRGEEASSGSPDERPPMDHSITW